MKQYLIEKLATNRKSARNFESTKLEPKDIESIIETIRMSPAAFGIFNLTILNVTSQKTKSDLAPMFFNQPNFINAPTYLIFVTDDAQRLKTTTINKTTDELISDPIVAEKFKKNFLHFLESQNSDERVHDWSNHSAYIALGFGLIAAEELGIDACAQTGFKSEQVNDYLKLNNFIDTNQTAWIGLALGYAKATDEVILKKRKKKDEFSKTI